MDDQHVLMIASDPKLRDAIPRELRQRKPSLRFKTVARVHDGIEGITRDPCDAVIFSVDTADELPGIARIQKLRSDLPVVMLTAIPEPELRSIGLQMGACSIVQRSLEDSVMAEALLLALEHKDLFRDHRLQLETGKRLIRDLTALGHARRDLLGQSLGLLASAEVDDFTFLLVQDDPRHTFILANAFLKAELLSSCRRVETVEQAIGYLKGEGPYQDRRSYPNPSLVISDLCEPGESGLKLLTWLRNQPSLRRMGFILYTSAENAKDADLAYALGANASVKKSADGRALVDIVKSAQLHFFRYRTGLHDA